MRAHQRDRVGRKPIGIQNQVSRESKLEFKISITLTLIPTLTLNVNVAGERFVSTIHSGTLVTQKMIVELD